MNGPRHYLEAERLIDLANGIVNDGNGPAHETGLQVTDLLRAAEVHAKLACAAATAMSAINHMDDDDFREWDKVAGVQLEEA